MIAGPVAERRPGGALLRPIGTFAGAIAVVAGPWLVSIAALALITIHMEPVMGRAAVEDMRLTVVYAFCLAPLVAGPIGAVAARRVGAGPVGEAHRVHAAAFVLSGALSAALAALVAWALGIAPLELGLAFVFLNVAASQLWITFALLGALRAHRHLVSAFAAGMCAALICVLAIAGRAPSVELLVWTFTGGILLSCALSSFAIRTRGAEPPGLLSALRALTADLGRERHLAFGVLCAIAGVWIDKWVLWLGPEGIRSAAGFMHYAPYDSAMFVAHMTVVPTLAALHLFHDGVLAPQIARFRAALAAGATHRHLSRTLVGAVQATWSGIFSILVFQGALTACFILAVPMLAMLVDLGHDQMQMLRTGLVATFLHCAMFLSCTIILLTGRVRHFLVVQGSFLALNGAASVAILLVSGGGAGGFLAASLLGSVAAFVVAYRALARFDYVTLLAENTGLFARP